MNRFDPLELGRLLRLGGPIVAASLLFMTINLTDIVMSGRYASSDLAGVALATAIVGPIIALLMGTLSGITPLVAQRFGAGGGAASSYLARQGVWIGMAISLVAMILIANGYRVIGWIAAGNSVDATAVSVGYLQNVMWGLPGFALYSVLRSASEGLGRTKPAMMVAAVTVVLNAVLNYAFIFGRLGAPEMGGVGCGVATAIVHWIAAATMVFVVRWQNFLPPDFFRRRLTVDRKQMREIVKVGFPIGLATFVEWGVFSLVAICLSRFGEAVVAAHSIATNINGLTFMIPHALGMAASIRVGHQVGRRDYVGAKRTGDTVLIVTFAFAALMAILLLIVREPLSALYTRDVDVQAVAAHVFVFVAVYQFIDNTQVTALGTLRGYKDTRVPLAFVLVAYWLLAIPVALILGFGWWSGNPMGIDGFWVGLGTGLLFVTVTLNLRRARLAGDVGRIELLADRSELIRS